MSPKLYIPGWVEVSNARCLVASMLKSQRTKHCKSQHIWIWLAGELPGMVQNCFDCADVLPRHRNAFNGLSFLHRSRFPVIIYADRFCIFQETQRTKAFDSTYVGKVNTYYAPRLSWSPQVRFLNVHQFYFMCIPTFYTKASVGKLKDYEEILSPPFVLKQMESLAISSSSHAL